MRIGVLANEESWYYRDLARAAELFNHGITRLDFPRLCARIDETGTRLASGESDVEGFDALIVRTMPPGSLEQVVYRMDALAAWEAAGVAVINPPKAVECAVDKFLTTHRLGCAGLRVPATEVSEDADSAMESFVRLGGDVVVKPLFGAEGRGIVRVSDPDLAWRTFRTLERLDAVLYLQEFIDHPGWDLRVLILDGTVIGGMKRGNEKDFRTNAARQAKMQCYHPTDQEQTWALAAANAVGGWFAGVDLLYNKAGLGYVIEVNAVPGWRAFARATGQDVAARLIEHLEIRVAERLSAKGNHRETNRADTRVS